MIDRMVPFESFRAEIEAAVLTPADEKRSNAPGTQEEFGAIITAWIESGAECP
jgi:hypothetical protein